MATKAMGWFRKNQKMIMVGVTIVAVLLFIVGDPLIQIMQGGSGSRGGFIGWVRNLFGGSQEDTVYRVAGTNYDSDAVQKLQAQRAFANDVMSTIASLGERRYLENLGFVEADFSDQQKFQTKLFEMMGKDPSIAEARGARDSALLNQIRPSVAVFGALGAGEDPRSISEYLLMKTRANDLGVTVTNAMIKEDLLKLGMGKVTLDEINAMVRNTARQRGQLDMAKLDTVLGVLADEVRVSIAKNVAGEDISQAFAEMIANQQRQQLRDRSRPAQVTVADLWNNYVDVKTSLNTGILPIKVEDFMSRVGEPTEAEKLALFEKYKKEYPSTDKDTPGFKIPPQYRIGFVFADMKEGGPAYKHYRAQVEAWDKLAPLNALAELAKAYEDKKDTYRTLQPFIEFAVTTAANSPWVRVYFWQAQKNQEQLVSTIGHFGLAMTQIATLSPANAFAMNLMGEVVPAENTKLIDAVSKAVAVAASPLGELQRAARVRTGAKEVYVPFEVVASALIEQRLESKSKEYLGNDLAELTTILSDYAKKYGEWRGKVVRKQANAATPPLYSDETKQTLADYITKFASTRGLTYYETKDLRSKQDLLNEPGERLLNTFIKPLFYDPSERASKRQLEDYVRFALVQDDLNGRKPKVFDANNTSVYDSTRKNKEQALYWVAEATEPRTPDFKEAEPAVTKAWKLEKARSLAEDEAKKIMKDVAAAPDNYRKLFDMKGYTPGQTIARYSEPEIKSFSSVPTYLPAKMPPVLDNEPNDFVNQALEKLKKKGDMTVIPDKTKSVYNLIYLSDRSEPRTSNPLDLEAFHNEVIRPSTGRQMTVEGMGFRDFVAQMKKSVEQKNWLDYLKGATKMNEELSKNLSSSRNR